MSGAAPAATSLPVANIARMVLWNPELGNVDADYDGAVTSADAAANPVAKAALALSGKSEWSAKTIVQDAVALVKKYDVSNRVGLPRPDGMIDQAELQLMFVAIQRKIEHQNPQAATPIQQLAATVVQQLDDRENGGNGDRKITAADRNEYVAPLLRLAGATSLDAPGLARVLARYDTFNAAKEKDGPDGKLGPMELGAFEADLVGPARRSGR